MTIPQRSVQPQAAPHPVQDMTAHLDAANDADILLALTHRAIGQLLRRKEDEAQRNRTLNTVSTFFQNQARVVTCPDKRLTALRMFSKAAIALVQQERDSMARTRPPVPAQTGRPSRRQTDIALTDQLSATEIQEPTTIDVIPSPPPETHDNFNSLFPAALGWRIRQATTFFQRRNPKLERELAPPFLLSQEFSARLMDALNTMIVPTMLKSARSLAVLETMRVWDGATTEDFWDFVEAEQSRGERIYASWSNVWGELKQERVIKLDKATKQRREVLVAPTLLKQLREKLAPAHPGEYDIPPLRNSETELLASLLLEFDRDSLDRSWEKLRQLYEQEMDRRWYQDKARQGALRDSLLDIFSSFPDRTGEFLVILCYFNFPHINLHFLERFTHNRGRTHSERVAKIPYLMRFLSDERVPRIRDAEMAADRERREAAEARRREEREE